MRRLLIGAAAAAFVAMSPATAQNARPNHGMMNRTEARTNVQGHVATMFTRLDTDRDGFISTAEVDAMQAKRAVRMQEKMAKRAANYDPARAFARLDTNKDGKLAKAEVEAVRAARAARAPDATAGGHGADRLFARADSNQDGVITEAEFQAQPKPSFDKTRMAHKGGGKGRRLGQADGNKDGKVSLAEAQQAALAHFDRADVNRDGTLTPEERRAMRKAMRAPG
ncbi:MAG: EF-hand domain-containing protein [Sphingomicrobium sp.]